MLFRWSVSSYVNWCCLTPFSFLNLRPLKLPVVQFSFAIFYICFCVIILTFQQTKLTLCFYDAFSYIHLPLMRWNSCLLAASPWVYSSVMSVLPLFSVSCFVLTQRILKLTLQRMFAPYKDCPFDIFNIFKVLLWVNTSLASMRLSAWR